MRAQMHRRLAIVIGAGDVGSAVAVHLQRAGLAVIICDAADPPWPRRGMAFTDAWYVGNAVLDQITAVFCSSLRSIPAVLEGRGLVAATTWSWTGAAEALRPAAIVDARMRKRAEGEDLRARAARDIVTVGIGPGFTAGGNVDLAVESAYGERLGAVVASGPTLAVAGEPRAIGGAGRERFVYAPAAGRFATSRRIGERVATGELTGVLGATAIFAPMSGVLRGLTARGARVDAGNKIVEVDPRGDATCCFGIAERPRAVAAGAVAALQQRAVVSASDAVAGVPATG
jgi:xanthine dehydrogenase accessory factor